MSYHRIAALSLTMLMVPWIGAADVTRRTSGGDGAGTAAPPRAVLLVTNHNALDMQLYAMRSGQIVVLGMVASYTTASFDLPTWMIDPAADIQFLADAIGALEAYLSDPIAVESGEEFHLTLESDINVSSLTTRRQHS